MNQEARDGSVGNLKPTTAESFFVGQEVYLAQEYYDETNATILDVPRYGWQVKSIVDGVACIEYQRHNLRLLMSLMVEIRFLKKDM